MKRSQERLSAQAISSATRLARQAGEAARAAALAQAERLRAIAEGREQPPLPTIARAATPTLPGTGTPPPESLPLSTANPQPVQTPSALGRQTPTPSPTQRYRGVTDAFPPSGFSDPREILGIPIALQAGGRFRVPSGPGWLTGWLDWGEVYSADARTTMGPSVATSATLTGSQSQTPSGSQSWSFSAGPFTFRAQRTPFQPTSSITWRPQGVLSCYPGGGPGVDFSQSLTISAEGRGLGQMWTVEYNPLDYRVTGGEQLNELPGYSGRAGVYFRFNPTRLALAGVGVVLIVVLLGELSLALPVLLPRLAEALSGAH